MEAYIIWSGFKDFEKQMFTVLYTVIYWTIFLFWE